jgi:protein gp37
MANRFKGAGQPYEGLIAKGGQWNGEIKLVPEKLAEPLHWRKPRMVFVNSMSDLFHENVPFTTIAQIFSVMSATTRHTFQILTKRPLRMLEFFEWVLGDYSIGDFHCDDKITDAWPEGVPWKGYDNCGPTFPYENIWLGVSVEDQQTADERIPLLLETPAAVRWISAEPLLGTINLERDGYLPHGYNKEPHCDWCEICQRADHSGFIDWVVVGGESGPNARPMQHEWAYDIHNQCKAAGVPFFFKQWGGKDREKGGCLINGKEFKQWPKATP